MRVAVSGATGFVGMAVTAALLEGGHEVVPLVRAGGAPGKGIPWDPAAGRVEPEAFASVDAVLHLAGENIAAGRWTEARKRAIRESRVGGTALLASAVASCSRPPRLFACASAVGIYGDRGGEELSEESPPGTGFLAETCLAWEEAARRAASPATRVVAVRTGMALHPSGGALSAMLPLFRLGLGGPVGSGAQYVSWIDRGDLARLYRFVVETDGIEGAVNATAPSPVTNGDFARALGKALGRPAFVPAPAFALRLVLGEMAEGLLLSGARVLPRKISAAGFRFRRPGLADALASYFPDTGGG
jgi:uncharacterized protein (TIGR01777 family)